MIDDATKRIAADVRAAIREGDADRTMSLIQSNRNVATLMTPFGTWLHVAASFGSLEIVKRLLDMGADVNAVGGTFNGAALKLACSNGHLEVVDYLLAHGARMDVSEPERNPLFGAIYGGHVDIAKALIAAGIDVHVSYSGTYMSNMDALAFARERGQTAIADILSGLKAP